MSIQNNYYLYILFDLRKPGKYSYEGLNMSFLYEPFYVGKGKNNRYKVHFQNTKKLLNESNNYLDNNSKELDGNLIKLRIINLNLKLGFKENDVCLKINDLLSEEDSIDNEKFLIKLIGRRDKGKGPLTNLTDGGDGALSVFVSDETRKKHSENTKGERNPFYGKHHTEDSKIRWIESRKGWKHKEVSKIKMSESRKGKSQLWHKGGSEHPFYGKHHTEDSKKLISIKNKGQVRNQNFRDKLSKANVGNRNNNSKYHYILYREGFFLYEGYSLTEVSKIFDLNYTMLNKIARSGHKYRGYQVFREVYKNNGVEVT